MSTYFESFLLFILCIAFFPTEYWNACHITFILLLFAIYCFELLTKNRKILTVLGISFLLLCLYLPELSVFLPLQCYIFFYRQQYIVPCLSLIPFSLYLYSRPDYVNFLILVLAGISFYLAYQNRMRTVLRETIHQLRDSSVEQEIILKTRNHQLIENQNDQIYIATLKERNRIAREIHDNVGHMLSRSILQVGAMLTICKEDSLKTHLESLNDTLNEAMNNIRESVHDLHDESIDLTDALQHLIKDFTFCPIHFDCTLSKQVPKEIKYCFLAIAKEGLNNVIKHSNATNVSLVVKEHPGFYQLLLEDNGTTSLPSDSNRGIGLTNMKERVDAVHGILHISTEKGYRIFVSIPK